MAEQQSFEGAEEVADICGEGAWSAPSKAFEEKME
jgi:hypothetical protein